MIEQRLAAISVGIGVDSINIVLLSLGGILLVLVSKQNKSHHIYITNLAFAELVWNITAAVFDVSSLILTKTKTYSKDKRLYVLAYAFFTGVTWNVTCSMFYLTADRLLQVYLGMKYNLYWSTKKTKILIAITWFVNIAISTTLAFCKFFFCV